MLKQAYSSVDIGITDILIYKIVSFSKVGLFKLQSDKLQKCFARQHFPMNTEMYSGIDLTLICFYVMSEIVLFAYILFTVYY